MLGLYEASSGAAEDAYEIETYGELRPASTREWLLTNGLGGYAHGTVADVNTRRYHACFVAAKIPPAGRRAMVSRLACQLTAGDQTHELWGGFFRYGLNGEGPRLLRRFQADGEVVRWEYDAEGIKVFKELFVCWHQNLVAARYTVRPPDDAPPRELRLRLTPFLPMREIHDLTHSNDASPEVDGEGDLVRVSAGGTTLAMRATLDDAGSIAMTPSADWWYGHTYPMEAARGMEDREDLFSPGVFEAGLPTQGGVVTLWMGLDDVRNADWVAQRERHRVGRKLRPMPTRTQRRLLRSASDFIVKRRRPDGMPGTTIIAGYPWYRDWGRDTFFALPGLLLASGRHDLAGQVLTTFASFVTDGLVPSQFDRRTNVPSFATVDASLWFVHASHAYLGASRDRDTFDAVQRPACEEVLNGYTRGTSLGIRVDPADGLVHAENPEVPLTWMDARAAGMTGEPVTPRRGKAVEINALWHNALAHMGDERAPAVARAFRKAFWLGDHQGLADVVTGTPGNYDRDETVRPNQIFAVSLPHSPLDRRDQRVVVDIVRRSLLTPYGLRTLARDDPRYEHRYTGGDAERARAAHNGSVWPWLIGPFLDAHLRIHDRSPASVDRARRWLAPLLEHLEEGGCVGSVAEVFDAEYPYRPGGCYAQAWSVAELFRLAVELEL